MQRCIHKWSRPVSWHVCAPSSWRHIALSVFLIVGLSIPAQDIHALQQAKQTAFDTPQTLPVSARLVRDVNRTTMDSSPRELTVAGDILYFAADDGIHGVELWRSDGTAANTTLVKDTAPGTDDTGVPKGSNPQMLTWGASRLFFVANDGVHGKELWSSDGTAAGTMLLRDITPDQISPTQPTNLTAVNGLLFFADDDGVHGTELWKSDGTPQGTTLVQDIYPGPEGSLGADLALFHNTLYFAADDGANGWELWTSDGTAAGTTLVVDLALGMTNQAANSSHPYGLTDVNGTLYFATNANECGPQLWPCPQLWKSDGSAQGTTLVMDFAADGQSVSPFRLTNINGVLFFILSSHCLRPSTCLDTIALWRSDGTAQGTFALTSLGREVEFTDLFTTPLTHLNGIVFFGNGENDHGYELWRSDGTVAGTYLLKDVRPGAESAWPQRLVVVNDTLFFAVDNGINGWQLWRSDGSADGTVKVTDFYPDPTMPPYFDAYPKHMVNFNGTLVLSANKADFGAELWKSAGTLDTTMLLSDINRQTSGSSPSFFLQSGGKLFFTADDGVTGSELWVSDGTYDGTHLVKDIMLGVGSGASGEQVDVDGTIFLNAFDADHGNELWESDGSAAGTALVRDIVPGPEGADPRGFVPLNGKLMFISFAKGLSSLWTSDGSEAGTVQIPAPFPANQYFLLSKGVVLNGILYFMVLFNGFDQVELWQSDGTVEHTVRIKSWPYASEQFHVDLQSTGTTLYVFITYYYHGTKIWKSDGTEAGTVLVQDIGPDAYDATPSTTTQVGDLLFFTTVSPDGATRLWRSDGSAAGTFTLTQGSTIRALAALKGKLAFIADNSPDSRQLWLSDGSAIGTRLITTISSVGGVNRADCDTSGIFTTGEQVFFAADNGQYGCEIWWSDGTAAGTTLFQDIAPGALSSFPHEMILLNDQLLLSADDCSHGRELWSIPLHPAFTYLPIIDQREAQAAGSDLSDNR